jgi:hypothetical protein
LLQQHQIRSHIADIAKTTISGSTGAAIPTASNGKTTKRFDKHSPQKGPVARPNSPPNNNDNASVDDLEVATATVQKIGKLNFPPLNPENQLQGTRDDHPETITTPIQNAPKKAPDCIRLEAAPPAAAPVTQAKNTTKVIVVLEVEDMPIESADDIFRVICPTCCDVVPKTHYAFHKNSKSCHSLARPPEVATATKTRQCDASTQLSTTATNRIATIYRTALRKPNIAI